MITVSIVEDDKDYREGLELLIRNSGDFRMQHAFATAEDALEGILLNPPDIAIIDIKLPGKSGIELIGEIKKSLPSLQCLVCSFYDDDEYVFKALKNGACGYMLKDALPQEILAALKELYAGGAPMNRYIARRVISAFQETKPVSNNLSELSDRENEILDLIATGLSVKEVSANLFLSVHTVAAHLKNIYTKLHVNNRVGAVNKLKR